MAVTGNRAQAGGGISIEGEGNSTLDRCLVSSNTASGQGGGLYISAGSGAIIKSSTFTANVALAGGGIANSGSVSFANNTVARNEASQAASEVLNVIGSRFDTVNSIFGPAVSQSVSLVEGAFRSTGNNLVTNTTGSTGWDGRDRTSANNGIDPMLGQLADNGGQLD